MADCSSLLSISKPHLTQTLYLDSLISDYTSGFNNHGIPFHAFLRESLYRYLGNRATTASTNYRNAILSSEGSWRRNKCKIENLYLVPFFSRPRREILPNELHVHVHVQGPYVRSKIGKINHVVPR